MKKPKKKAKVVRSNWAIIGRIPFDEEDTCFCYNKCTEAEALEQFEADMIAADGRTKEQILQEGNGEDMVCFVNTILRSDRPIIIKASI